MVDSGKLIWIDYDAWYEDNSGKRILFDTTNEEEAKKADIYKEGMTYTSMPMVAGEGTMIKGLEKAILEAKENEEKEVEIPPEEGFGERDPKLVMLVPMNKLLKAPQFQGENAEPPRVGMEVELGGRKGTIIHMHTSRARIDFNHKYAGKKLVYKFKVKKVAETPEDKVRGILGIHYGFPEKFEIEFPSKEEVNLRIPDIAKVDHNWFHVKYQIIADIRSHIEDIKTIRFIEEYVKKVKEEAKETKDVKEEVKEESEKEDKEESESKTDEEKKK